MCQFRVYSCVLGRCTRSVGNAPLLIGCSAPDRVHGHVTGAAPPCFWQLWRLPGTWVPSAGGSLRPRVVVLRNVACNSRVNISNIEIVSLKLQCFEVLQKVRAPELHATDG